MPVIPEHNQKALKVMKWVCVICERIDIHPYYLSHFLFKQHIIYQLCCQMLHVIVFSRRLGGKEGRRTEGGKPFPSSQEKGEAALVLKLVTVSSFQVVPRHHGAKVEQHVKRTEVVQPGQPR